MEERWLIFCFFFSSLRGRILKQLGVWLIDTLVTHYLEALDAILRVQLGGAGRMLLRHPAMEILLADVGLAIMGHRHSQQTALLDGF